MPADAFTAQEQVSAGENATYAMQAINQDGLVSRLSDPVAVDSADYGLAAEARDGGITLRWRQAEDEFPAARIVRSSWIGQRELGPVRPGSYEDHDVEPGRSYRYVVVARRADGSEAPRFAAPRSARAGSQRGSLIFEPILLESSLLGIPR